MDKWEARQVEAHGQTNGWAVIGENGESITGWGCVNQTEANARLIAAAPDMYEALEELFIMAKHYKPLPNKYNPRDEDEEMWALGLLYKDVEAAIAKAKGE